MLDGEIERRLNSLSIEQRAQVMAIEDINYLRWRCRDQDLAARRPWIFLKVTFNYHLKVLGAGRFGQKNVICCRERVSCGGGMRFHPNPGNSRYLYWKQTETPYIYIKNKQEVQIFFIVLFLWLTWFIVTYLTIFKWACRIFKWVACKKTSP